MGKGNPWDDDMPCPPVPPIPPNPPDPTGK